MRCGVPAFPLGECVCQEGGLESGKSLSFLMNEWIGMMLGTHIHTNTQAQAHTGHSTSQVQPSTPPGTRHSHATMQKKLITIL